MSASDDFFPLFRVHLLSFGGGPNKVHKQDGDWLALVVDLRNCQSDFFLKIFWGGLPQFLERCFLLVVLCDFNFCATVFTKPVIGIYGFAAFGTNEREWVTALRAEFRIEQVFKGAVRADLKLRIDHLYSLQRWE